MSILVTGMLFYSKVEHWRPLDALYFSVVTLTTVGYGDFAPQTDLGKSFTVFYLLLGIGVLLALIAVIADHTIDNYRKLTEAYISRSEQDTERVVKKLLRK
ncbi:MAG TPA: potassium channel family protein [Candidatus Limnocylindria bacterium]|nr:potassium channel family protein [Candidatus Limnocylindria bacterium]